MFARHLSTCLGAAALAVLSGCPKDEAVQTPPATAKTKAPAPADPAAATPPPAPAAAEPTDPMCMAAWDPTGDAVPAPVGDWELVRTGTKLTGKSKTPDDAVVFGVIADVKENTPQNLANIEAIKKFFKDKGAEAIVVAGDLGDTQEQISQIVNSLAETGLPLFTIIGNREGRVAYAQALKAASARGNVFDLNATRLVLLDHVALVSLPGYYNKVYIHAKDGCSYSPADVDRTRPIIQAAEGKTVVMVSHGPPRQDGVDALDRTLEQVNVGDPELAKLLRDSNVKFGVFANIHEAGGRATDLAGKRLIKADTWSDELYMNPGPADSVRWQMNDGSESVGMAAILRVKDKQASFETLRIPKS